MGVWVGVWVGECVCWQVYVYVWVSVCSFFSGGKQITVNMYVHPVMPDSAAKRRVLEKNLRSTVKVHWLLNIYYHQEQVSTKTLFEATSNLNMKIEE